LIGSLAPHLSSHLPWEAVRIYEASLAKVRPIQALTLYIPTSLGTCKEKQREKADCSDTIDPDLNMNATNYRDNHKHRDAVEIILHFINVKY